ncbi:NAD-dependent epimerase/dehydratase family protein [Roseixanthobacter liquoris]|uniref:NAD-dependent epimerase/dehydratase family protein n=1 Tax=Roseixanthobacter liquoris TaxID=3119921 RepID=UPI003727380D
MADVFRHTAGVWAQMRGARIFVTGGTGFVGCWLLESLRYAETRQPLDIEVTVLTRNVDAFAAKAPHLASFRAFKFVTGDVRDFTHKAAGFTHLIHAATDASADLNEHNPLKMFDTVLTGTRTALNFAVENKIPRVLYLSSGAVYGQQPWEMEHVAETWRGAPDCTQARNAYAEGKRAAEMLCAIYRAQFGLSITTARIFALLGPYISLDIHFAAGNFIRDAMAGKPVIVNGNGMPVRSYMYAGDLTTWLWHLLARGEDGAAYNVGSDQGISIRDLAQIVSRTVGNGEFTVLGAVETGWNPGRYVPETKRAATKLELFTTVPLEDAIRRTAMWNGWKQ